MRRSIWWVVPAVLFSLPACKDPQMAEAEARQRTAAQKLAEGHQALIEGKPSVAVRAAKESIAARPTNPQAYALLADAHRQEGNLAAAVLAIRQAEELQPGDPTLTRQRAELYRHLGQPELAIGALGELRQAGQLADADVLLLARMQGQQGQVEEAFRTLEAIQKSRPDEVEAKVVESELLLLAGDELLATRLMDRILEEHPELISARLLRARYFLNNNRPDLTELDLAELAQKGTMVPEVVELRARALLQMKRYEDAAGVLTPRLEAEPNNPELLARVAEIHLNLGQWAQTEELVERALSIRPSYARALFVQGRMLEVKDLAGAEEVFVQILRADPNFAPALSRMWRIHRGHGRLNEAMAALEKLFFLQEATLEERVALAELYAEGRTNLDRGRKLIGEALRQEPENPHYKKIRAALGKPQGGPPKVIILRGGR